MYVCICNAVSDADINREIDAGAVTLDALRDRLNVANACGHCSVYIEDRLVQKLEFALSHLESRTEPRQILLSSTVL